MTRWIQHHGATWLLVVMGAIFLASYPFHHDPWGGLITHVSGAAMIGGLADWYAVTALFAKPLGISYKTALIPRSKDRFVEMARHMMIDELLRVPHMYEVMKQEAVPYRMIQYMNSLEGRGYIHVLFEELRDHVVPHLNGQVLRDQVLHRVRDGVFQWRITPFLWNLGKEILQPTTAAILWLQVNRMLQRIIVSEGIRPYLLRMVESMLDRYAEDSFLRELALVFGGKSVSPDYLVDVLQRKGRDYLASQEGLETPLGAYVYDKVVDLLVEFSQNAQWQAFVEDKKGQWFQNFLEDGTFFSESGDIISYVKRGEEEVYHYLEQLATDAQQGAVVERYIRFHLVKVLEKVRPFIESSVVKEMNRYTPEEITDLLRSKLGYDLQMIRINGSLVGAVLGGLFYGLSYLLKGGLLP